MCWVFFAPLRHSLVLESGGFSSWGVQASHCGGPSYGGAQALGMRAQ